MPRVVHFEIQSGEPEKTIEFYRELLGWQFNKWDGPMEYWMIITGPDDQPGINGGLMRRPGEIDGQAVIAYVCTVDVPDIDTYSTKATKLGGQIVVPMMPIPGVGWLVYLKDPAGNIFGMIENDSKAG